MLGLEVNTSFLGRAPEAISMDGLPQGPYNRTLRGPNVHVVSKEACTGDREGSQRSRGTPSYRSAREVSFKKHGVISHITCH
jgi:hypothetical protein